MKAPRLPDTATHAPIVEFHQEFGDCRVELGQVNEGPTPKAFEQPALDDQNCRFDLCPVARSPWSRRQHRAVVMRSHFGIAAVDLRIVQACLDDRDLALSGTNNAGAPPNIDSARV